MLVFLCFSVSVYSGTYLNSCMNLVVYSQTDVVPICKFLNSSAFASIVTSMRWYLQNACANFIQPMLAGLGWLAQKQSHHKLAMPLSCRVAMFRPSLSVHFTRSSLLLIPRNQSSASIGLSAWSKVGGFSLKNSSTFLLRGLRDGSGAIASAIFLQDMGLVSYSYYQAGCF